MMVRLYRGLTNLGGPLIDAFLQRRMARGKEDPLRFGERRGQAGLPRPQGPLVWLHAASVGESLSMLPLIERIVARPGFGVLVTTGTVTSARMMQKRLPPGAFHQFVPVDRLAFVRPFLDHWRPDLALWAESEFWPNLVLETQARDIPLVLVNGRVSERSFRGWQRVPNLARQLLSAFSLCLGQTQLDADRLSRLGAKVTRSVGNLKFAVPPLPVDAADFAAFQAKIGGRKVWLAASTHLGEDEIMGRVHRTVQTRLPGVLTIIVPRHPERGPAIAAALRNAGLVVSRRAAGEDVAPDTDIYVADTMGELGLFFRLAQAIFMGKSLGSGKAGGGQNPIEPARLGRPVLFGPNMDNFVEIARRMTESKAARQVADATALARALGDVLADPQVAAEWGARALTFAESEAHVLDDVMAVLAPFLDTIAARHARP